MRATQLCDLLIRDALRAIARQADDDVAHGGVAPKPCQQACAAVDAGSRATVAGEPQEARARGRVGEANDVCGQRKSAKRSRSHIDRFMGDDTARQAGAPSRNQG